MDSSILIKNLDDKLIIVNKQKVNIDEIDTFFKKYTYKSNLTCDLYELDKKLVDINNLTEDDYLKYINRAEEEYLNEEEDCNSENKEDSDSNREDNSRNDYPDEEESEEGISEDYEIDIDDSQEYYNNKYSNYIIQNFNAERKLNKAFIKYNKYNKYGDDDMIIENDK